VLTDGIILVRGGGVKLAAVVVVVAALVLGAAQAAERKTVMPPVLGFDQTKIGVYRLAWFDPTTLTTLRGPSMRTTPLPATDCNVPVMRCPLALLQSCDAPLLSSGDFGVQRVHARLPQGSVVAQPLVDLCEVSGRRFYTRN
jgi:hypothetical protein